MTHQRNTEGLLNNAKKKSREVFQRAEQAITLLIKQRKAVNFKTVAETSGVSLPYLYKTNSLRQRIEHLRKEQVSNSFVKVTKPSENSKDSIIEILKTRIKELQKENQELKKQIEVAYGRIVLLDSSNTSK